MQKEYDYYFSQKHKDYLKNQRPFLDGYSNTYINGVEYTECIEKGLKPLTSGWEDLKLVFSGIGKINFAPFT